MDSCNGRSEDARSHIPKLWHRSFAAESLHLCILSLDLSSVLNGDLHSEAAGQQHVIVQSQDASKVEQD